MSNNILHNCINDRIIYILIIIEDMFLVHCDR